MKFILSVDPVNGFKKERIDDNVLKNFLGGSGLGSWLMYRKKLWEFDPLSEKNALIILPGLLTGSGYPTASKTIFMARSPLTMGVGRASAGSTLGPALAGMDLAALVIENKAEKWSGIIIKEDDVEIKNAEDLIGLDTLETTKRLNDEKFASCVIGPAGENLSLISTIESEGRQAARTGLGAVMGSKKIKYILVEKKGLSIPARKEEFRNDIKDAMSRIMKDPRKESDFKYGTAASVETVNLFHGAYPAKNFQQSYFEEAYRDEKNIPEIDPRYWTEKFKWKIHPCPNCAKPCSRYLHIESKKWGSFDVEGLEYETIYSLGSMLNIKSIEDIAYLHYMADRYGLDAISAGVTIAWAMEMAERNLLPEDFTDHMIIRFGNADTAFILMKKMAYREGKIGELLADGVKRASERIGKGKEFAMHSKGLEPPAYDVRALKGMALAVATSVRGWDHLDSQVYAAEFNGKFWYFTNVDRRSAENKAFLVKSMQDFSTVFDITGICKFSRSSLTPDFIYKAISDFTGFGLKFEDIMEIAERVYNLQKLFNIRCGLGRKDDSLPERITNEPIAEGPSRGLYVPKDELERMIDEYYQARGWNRDGIPEKLKLKLLNIEE